MFLQILTHTPRWVFALLVLLVAYGITQLRTREMAMRRIVGVAAGLTALGGYGVASVFGASLWTLLVWAAAAAVLVAAVLRFPPPAAARYDAGNDRVLVPGSVVPLLLMLGIFLTKFGVGVALVMHPELRATFGFALAAALLYGAFSGIFAGRALRLWKLART